MSDLKNVEIIKEVDALEESVKWMKGFEKKYNMSSYDFYKAGTLNPKNEDEADDECFWEFYIDCFLSCAECFTSLNREIEDNKNDPNRVEIFRIPYRYIIDKKGPFWIKHAGYILMEKFDEAQAWYICNWSCYQDTKPENLFADIEVANTEVFFYDKISNLYYVPLRCGWTCCKSLFDVANLYKSLKGIIE